MADVVVGGVASVGMFEGAKERVRMLGNDDQVDMIGHETVARQRQVVEAARLSEKVEIGEVIGIGFEDEAAIVTALGDMVWGVESDDASEAGHKRECGERIFSRKRPVCPGFFRRFFPCFQ